MFTLRFLKSSDFDLEIYYICNTDKFIILMIMFFHVYDIQILFRYNMQPLT